MNYRYKNYYKYFLFFILYLFPAALQADQLIKQFDSWSLYFDNSLKSTSCYLMGRNNSIHNQDSCFLVYLNADNNHINISSGYAYKKDYVTLIIAGKNYDLFTKDKLAWSYDKYTDNQIIYNMTLADNVIIKYVDIQNNKHEEVYSLKSFKKAYNMMTKLCK